MVAQWINLSNTWITFNFNLHTISVFDVTLDGQQFEETIINWLGILIIQNDVSSSKLEYQRG